MKFPGRRFREREPGGGPVEGEDVSKASSILRPVSQWRRESPPTAEPTVTLETPPRRLGKAKDAAPFVWPVVLKKWR